jgi:uncharacterized protein YndB with AHSA1/START domain
MKKITVRVTVSQERSKVWEYYTNPVHIVKWNFADSSWHCPTAENDLRVGGTCRARMEAKDGSDGFDFEAVYTEVIVGEQLTYEFGGRHANVTFESHIDQTTVTVTFDPEAENSADMQQAGWQSILDNFKQYVEHN